MFTNQDSTVQSRVTIQFIIGPWLKFFDDADREGCFGACIGNSGIKSQSTRLYSSVMFAKVGQAEQLSENRNEVRLRYEL